MSAELWQALLGPVGALALAMAGLYRLWSELQAAKARHEALCAEHAKERNALHAKLEVEQDARFADARETTTALLKMQERVIRAVELFEERPCLAERPSQVGEFYQELPTQVDLPRPHQPPVQPPATTGSSLVPNFARRRMPSSPGSGEST